jgi:mono/diheme cytochrome c family protein
MRLACFTFLAILADPVSAVAADPVDYRKDIKPVLQARCYACHGVLAQKSKLRVDSGAGMLKAEVIVPGKPAESALLTRISSEDEATRMPPEGHPLKPEEIARIKAWIEQGAKVPADDAPEPDPRDHWSFRTPSRPAVPAISNPPSTTNNQQFTIRNPIDAFVAAQWIEKGLKPSNPADKRVLLRRVYLDLTGLPPTSIEIDAFLADSAPDAYEKVVDKLLASPQYGERWGRHFLDVWRYSDWWGLGGELRNSQRHIWHWRDWVVESFNADLGYDEMIRQMLAADELYPTDAQKLRATGYLARSYFLFNRSSWLDEVVEHTGKAFLGLTFNCAKCHDHKYDPIRQLDYYQFRAIFEPYQLRTDFVAGEMDVMKDGIPRAFDSNLDAKTPFHIRGDERNPDPNRIVNPGLPPFLAPNGFKFEPVKLPLLAYRPGARPEIIESYRRATTAKLAAANDALAKARASLVVVKAEPSKPKSATEGKIVFKDDFAKLNADVWELGLGMWKHDRNRLVQQKTGDGRSHIRMKTAPPTDFEARFRFTITGGDPYKSVGIAYDVSEGNEAMVYVSAGGSKVQVAYKNGGDYLYPADGALNTTIPVNKPIELAIRVRGTLVNVSLDGNHALAYTLPIARKGGKLDLLTYTASAEFTGFELRELPAELELVQPGSKPGTKVVLTPEIAQARVVAAEKAVTVAEAELAAITVRAIADQNGTKDDARLAAKAEKLLAVSNAELALAQAEVELLTTAPATRPAAEMKRKTAVDALAAARKATETQSETYSPLAGAVKTAESNIESAASKDRPFPDTSTGRRTALAKWLSDSKNPLTARVAVNHIWLRHFGKPLVANVFEFGRKGTAPNHPQLLDWLAVELMEHNWSFKHLHRAIVTSNVYRLSSSSANAEANSKLDPENRYLWRMNPMRMEAQVIRDSLLNLAGDLDLTRGGPPVPLGEQENSRRRAMYFFHSHNEHNKLLDVFDNANVLECYRRTESIVPQQALALWNSRFALAMSGKINDALHTRLGEVDDTRFVNVAFETILGTTPSKD